MLTGPNSPFVPLQSEELSLQGTYPHSLRPCLNIVPFYKLQIKESHIFKWLRNYLT